MRISNNVQMVFDKEIRQLYNKLAIIQEYLEDDSNNNALIYGIICMALDDLDEIQARPKYEVSLEVTMEEQQ